MNARVRERSEVDRMLSVPGRSADDAGVADSVRDDLNVQPWQDRPRPWDYDDPEEYRAKLEKFMSEVVWAWT